MLRVSAYPQHPCEGFLAEVAGAIIRVAGSIAHPKHLWPIFIVVLRHFDVGDCKTLEMVSVPRGLSGRCALDRLAGASLKTQKPFRSLTRIPPILAKFCGPLSGAVAWLFAYEASVSKALGVSPACSRPALEPASNTHLAAMFRTALLSVHP